MNETQVSFTFDPTVDLNDAEDTLLLARIAAEGLHGEARVRTEVSHAINPFGAENTISGRTAATAAVTQIFTSLLTREFGRDAFRVRRQLAGAEAAVCG
jgi:hypothetical protein